jgi:hypothetical protein
MEIRGGGGFPALRFRKSSPDKCFPDVLTEAFQFPHVGHVDPDSPCHDISLSAKTALFLPADRPEKTPFLSASSS